MRIILLFMLVLGTALASGDFYKDIGSYFIANISPLAQFQVSGGKIACLLQCTSLGSACSFAEIDSSSSWCSLYSTSSVAYSVQLAASTNTTVWQKLNNSSNSRPIYIWTTSYDSTLANYWPIQSGTTYDVIKGAHMTSSTPILVSGRSSSQNSAVRVSNTSSYFVIPAGYYLNGSGSFSIVLWIRPITCPYYPRFLKFSVSHFYEMFSINFQDNNCNAYWDMFIGSDNIGDNNPEWISSQAFAVGYWNQLAVKFDQTTRNLKFFVNATQAATTITSNVLNNVSYAQNYLGIDAPGGTPIDADFDELRLYNRALTLSELQDDMSKTDSYLVLV